MLTKKNGQGYHTLYEKHLLHLHWLFEKQHFILQQLLNVSVYKLYKQDEKMFNKFLK